MEVKLKSDMYATDYSSLMSVKQKSKKINI